MSDFDFEPASAQFAPEVYLRYLQWRVQIAESEATPYGITIFTTGTTSDRAAAYARAYEVATLAQDNEAAMCCWLLHQTYFDLRRVELYQSPEYRAVCTPDIVALQGTREFQQWYLAFGTPEGR